MYTPPDPRELDRRTFLRLAAAAAVGSALLPASRGAGAAGPPATPATGPANPPGVQPGAEMVRFPEKTDLILVSDRPPNLEMPVRWFREDLTPNDAFFVRWHLAVVPTRVDPATFRLKVGGHVEQEQSLSLDDLRKSFEPFTVVAVNQCSGNSRSLQQPRVPGSQWVNGAVGNARWTGVRVKDLLARTKAKAGAVDVTFQGLDRAPLPTVPEFVKSLPFDVANAGEAMVAYEMNGQPLPMLNGFPLRLVVPGWFGTYWVKALARVNVTAEPFKGFWMEKAYRIPKNPEMNEDPKDLAKETVPINVMPVRSLFARPEPGERIAVGATFEAEGVAWDAGKGIKAVDVSADGGRTWDAATLGPDLGNYSWRRWRFKWQPPGPGRHVLQARATNNAGQTQPATPIWNRSGYGRSVIESVEVVVG